VVEDVPVAPIVVEKTIATGSKRRRGGAGTSQPVEIIPPSIKHRKPSLYTWGSLDVDDLLARMSSEGILVAKPEPDSSGNCVIHLVISFQYNQNCMFVMYGLNLFLIFSPKRTQSSR